MLQGQTFADWDDLYYALRQRRVFLNTRLPCASLNDKPPLVAYPQAQTPRRPYRPEWEAELLDLGRVYEYLAQGRWFRKAGQDGITSLGGQSLSVLFVHQTTPACLCAPYRWTKNGRVAHILGGVTGLAIP